MTLHVLASGMGTKKLCAKWQKYCLKVNYVFASISKNSVLDSLRGMVAMATNLVAVKCILFPGVFPSERQFEVTLANGDTHTGISPRHFCWNKLGKIIEEEEVTDGAEGSIAAKLISYDEILPEGVQVVEVPDGEFLAVNKYNILSTRPTKVNPPGVEVL
jgi:hypothetical protein